MFVLKQSAIVR